MSDSTESKLLFTDIMARVNSLQEDNKKLLADTASLQAKVDHLLTDNTKLSNEVIVLRQRIYYLESRVNNNTSAPYIPTRGMNNNNKQTVSKFDCHVCNKFNIEGDINIHIKVCVFLLIFIIFQMFHIN